jgi:hypothetical protein
MGKAAKTSNIKDAKSELRKNKLLKIKKSNNAIKKEKEKDKVNELE